MKPILFCLVVLCLAACADLNQAATPAIAAVEAVEITYIEQDDDQVDTERMGEAKTARLATALWATTYFQFKADDGDRYMADFTIEDYWFANPADATESITPETAVAKKAVYTKVAATTDKPLKSKSLRVGKHFVVMTSPASTVKGSLMVEAGKKKTLHGRSIGGDFWVWDKSFTIRATFDSLVPRSQGLSTLYIKLFTTAPTWPAFFAELGNSAVNAFNSADLFFELQTVPRKAYAVRMEGADDLTRSIPSFIFSATSGQPAAGKPFNFKGKRGISVRFK